MRFFVFFMFISICSYIRMGKTNNLDDENMIIINELDKSEQIIKIEIYKNDYNKYTFENIIDNSYNMFEYSKEYFDNFKNETTQLYNYFRFCFEIFFNNL